MSTATATPTVTFLDVTDEAIKAELLSRLGGADKTIDAIKRSAVERITGGPVPENLTPLQAWMKWLHESNGYEYEQPAHPDIANAVAFTGATRFLFWLA